MNELSEIREMVYKIHSTQESHIAETKAYRIEKDKVISSLSDTVWDKDGKPGLATKVDRLVQTEETRKVEIPELSKKVDRLSEIEKNRKWTIRAIGSALLGLILQQIASYFHK